MTRLNYWNWNKNINLFCILRNYSEWEVGGEVALALLWLLLASMSTIFTEMRDIDMAWQGSFISCLRPELSSISLLSILYSSLDTYLSISISLLELSLSLSICLLWMTVCCSSICAAESSSTFTFEWKIVVSSIFGHKDEIQYFAVLCAAGAGLHARLRGDG